MEGEETSTTNYIERECRDKRGVLNEKQFLKLALEKKKLWGILEKLSSYSIKRDDVH